MAEKTEAREDLQGENERLRARVAELSAAMEKLGATEARLRESEETYRALVDTSPIAVTMTDLEGRITYVSQITLQLHGFERAEEMLGMSAFDLIAPEERERAVRGMQRTFEEGRIEDVEYTMLRKDGGTFVGELNAGVLRDCEGSPYAFLGMTRDVTERRRMENALRASEERYRDLVENVNETIYLLDLDGAVVYVSPAIETITGYEPSELTGRRITDYIHPDDAAAVREGIANVIEGGLGPTEVRAITRSGDVRWVRASSRRVQSKGKAVGLRGVLTDITERKEAEEDVAFLGSIIENLKESFLITDLDYRITYINKAAEELFGYNRDELVGKTPDMLNAEPNAESMQKEIYDTVSAGGVWEREIRNKRKDGSTFINEVRVSPLYDESGNIKFYIGMQRDVTEKRRLRQELLQAQKMEAVGTMAGGIAHDFNNLLTAIMGYSDLILPECEPGSQMRKDVEEICKTARRAAALTRRLLSFSRRQAVQAAPVDMNTVVAGLERILGSLLPGGVELTTDLSPDLKRVEADAAQLEQVIVNLVMNSRDAMPGGGRLSISTENVTLDDASCRRVAGARPGEWVRLSIADNGRGMDSNAIKRIFEPFYTTKEAGTGLGLSVVHGIVKQHKGCVDVASEPGRGSTFSVYLPATSKRSVEKAARPGTDIDVRGGTKRVLFVEDQEVIAKLDGRVLSEKGYTVFRSRSVAEATDIYAREGGRFDIVFSDVVLPDGSGVDLVGRIRADNPRIPVLLTSGFTEGRMQWTMIKERGYSFIRKPYEMPDLLKALREALAGGESNTSG